jgi:nitrite reductase [NAD(P)H] small subunit
MAKHNWVSIGDIEDIPRTGARVVNTEFGNIAVFRTHDDKIYALEDKCPHLGGALSAGLVHGAQVTCPLHSWVIDLKSGGVVGPDEGCTLSVPVRLETSKVQLDLSVIETRVALA